jgi:hypothetical protein
MLKNHILNDNKKKIFFVTTVIIIIFFFNSLLLNRNIYNNHVNLIYITASDFINSKILYKEIYVKYGIGEIVVNALGLYLFGNNIFSLFLLTNLFYFFSIFVILLICLKLQFTYIENLFIILFLINIHPSPNWAPWPNYLSFLPIVISIYFLCDYNKKKYFFSGLSVSLACLIRETILLSALNILFLVTLLFFLTNRNKFYLIKFYILGFLLPLAIFVTYMFLSSNYLIWQQLIFPSYKFETLSNLGYFIDPNASDLKKLKIIVLGPFREITLQFLRSVQYFSISWILILAAYLSCLYCFFKNIIRREFNLYIIISIYSLSLILQNLHLMDVMRVSTGSIVGLIVLNEEIKKIVKNKIFIYTIILLLLLINSKEFYKSSVKNAINNFSELIVKKSNSNINYDQFSQFKNMNYDQSIHKFYKDFQKNCQKIKKENGIEYSINRTENWDFDYYCGTKPHAYFPISPILRPYFLEIYNNSNLVNKKNIQSNKNTVIFYNSDVKNINDYKTLYSYDIYKNLKIEQIKEMRNKIRLNIPTDFFDLTHRYILIIQKKD